MNGHSSNNHGINCVIPVSKVVLSGLYIFISFNHKNNTVGWVSVLYPF